MHTEEAVNLEMGLLELSNQKTKKRRMKEREERLQVLWNTIKWINIGIMEVLEGEEREKKENLFEK